MSEQRDIGVDGSTGQPEGQGRSLIAVIGIDRYRSWSPLSNAVNDARGALAMFKRLGFVEAVPELIDGTATGRAIQSLVTDDLVTLGPDDSLVLFYAGHGGNRKHRVGGREIATGYLIPFDAEDKASTWVDLDSWLRAVALMPAKHILVILDACHSGIALDPVIKWRDSTSWRGEPLSTLKGRQSRRIITSALGDERVMDGGPYPGHSLFTGCLIEALTHGLHRDDKPVTTGSELGLYVQQRVRSYPHSQQTPDFGTFAFDERGEMTISLVLDADQDAIVSATHRDEKHNYDTTELTIPVWGLTSGHLAEESSSPSATPNAPATVASPDREPPMATLSIPQVPWDGTTLLTLPALGHPATRSTEVATCTDGDHGEMPRVAQPAETHAATPDVVVQVTLPGASPDTAPRPAHERDGEATARIRRVASRKRVIGAIAVVILFAGGLAFVALRGRESVDDRAVPPTGVSLGPLVEDKLAATETPAPGKSPRGSAGPPSGDHSPSPPVPPAAPAGAVPATLPAETGSGEPVPIRAAAPSPAPGACFADVSSMPAGAEIVLDQANVIGTTPQRVALPCGRPVDLLVRKPHLVPATHTITPTPEGASIQFVLVRQTFLVKVSTTPPGATVTLGGKSLGITPTMVRVPAFESSTLSVAKDGYQTESETVAPRGNGTAVHTVLRKIERKKLP